MRFTLGGGFALLLASASSVIAASDAPLQVIVSTQQQSIVVYDGNTVIATSKVSTGKAGHSTPTGIFSILEKRRHHKSNIYSNAPMPFMQRLTWSGIALHGSGHVPKYPASHGCVRLPSKFAAKLFKMTRHGMHVLISDRQVVPAEISSDSLFQPNQTLEEKPAPLSDVPLRPALSQKENNPLEVAMIKTASVPTASAQSPAPIRILITRRSTRDTVRELQMLLNSLGFDAGVPDGWTGPATSDAVRAFQSAEGLPPDGKITPELIDKVFRKAGREKPSNGILLVRQRFQPLFSADVDIEQPEAALGTHFLQFQDHDPASGTGKWFGVSLENHLSASMKKRLGVSVDADPSASNALQATLDRIIVSADVRARIVGLLVNGSSLSISDSESGQETGEGTDFITITRSLPH
ncbi:L,D-transpeptidase family protein [Sinorhizobium garamanticum]|uniref:L,D-transpeptidase family protein n=1 Tax=Sinorhizobium garamanticum TaxID=680247 RepID=A0ABY8DJ69_9HYPH|nr:L,D-transpeptidase family protein [Sinorhizobium garamanticum]WEX89575.1 L,D-transpeptidase family protein [Sinorhizobium garamanticum]